MHALDQLLALARSQQPPAPEPPVKQRVPQTTKRATQTILDIEPLRMLVDAAYAVDIIPNPKERDKVIWQFIAEQLDRLGLIVEGYYRQSVYRNYVEDMLSVISKQDTVITNNINHLPGGCTVRLRVMPMYAIIERQQ